MSTSRVAVFGNGVVGRRLVKHITAQQARTVVQVDSRRDDIASTPFLEDVRVAVLAQPGPHHRDTVALLDRGIGVISIGDEVRDVAAIMGESDRALRGGVPLIAGAGMSPGLLGSIARHLASQIETVDEIHVAIHGTAGPACARQHHRALAGKAHAYHEGTFVTFRAGTGRELAWFPEPVGAYDCYRAEVPAPTVLHRTFPEASRITARMSANRRDRLTSRLPMLTPPHGEGGVGALRVEVRGADETGSRVTLIAGIAEMVGTSTAATVMGFLEAILAGTVPVGLTLPGDDRLDNVSLLRTIQRFGVRLQEFTGVPSA
ncbi:hypothetical protein [Ilumatobacter nonamiensis]|uniref:hypothetical protein n=1 Tax=Ilumatobacter nonamiensis TaxID=467093 RepID=UPI00058CC369|nr:hypothetical protein [Ilumatobacter nonamiensis]